MDQRYSRTNDLLPMIYIYSTGARALRASREMSRRLGRVNPYQVKWNA